MFEIRFILRLITFKIVEKRVKKDSKERNTANQLMTTPKPPKSKKDSENGVDLPNLSPKDLSF
jgi:hypothetical protein